MRKSKMKKLESPFSLIKKSWDLFTKKENFLPLIKIYSPIALMSLVTLVPSLVPSTKTLFDNNNVAAVIDIAFAVISIFVNLAGIKAVAKVIDGGTPDVQSIFDETFSKFPRFLLLSVILFLIYTLGLALLIVPFVLVITWFSFSQYIFVEKGVGIKLALTESKKAVKGRFWQVLGRIMVFGLFSLLSQAVLSALPLGIGVVVYYLCGGLFLMPLFLLYRQAVSI